MRTVPLTLLTPYSNRELTTSLVQSATGLPPAGAHSIVLTLDATATAVLQAAGITVEESRLILSALFRHPARLHERPIKPSATATGGQEQRFQHELGQRIHVIRHARRLTPAGIEHRTGIKPCVLRVVEDGDLWPSGLHLYRLATAFAVPLPMLVDHKATPLRVLRLLSGQTA